MTAKKDTKVFECKDKAERVVAFRINWTDRDRCLIEELLTFSRESDVEYRFIERFGTTGSTDLIVVLPGDAKKMERFLKERGMYVSRHDACNVVGKLLTGWKEK